MIEFLIFPITFISAFGFSYLYYKLVNCKNKITLKTVLIFLVGVTLFSMVKYFNVEIISAISFFWFFPILFGSIYFSSFKDLAFYTIIIWLYSMIIDLIIMLVISFINYGFNFNIYGHLFEMLPTIIVFIVIILLANSTKLKHFTNYLYHHFIKIGFLDFLTICFTVYIFVLGITLSFNIENLELDLLLIFIMIISSLYFVMLVREAINKYENNLFLKTLKENNDFYISMNDENRIFKHNLMAKLLSIKSVSNKKARILIDDFLSTFNNIDFSFHIKDIPYGINGLLYQKLYPYLDTLDIKIDNLIDYDIFGVLTPRRYNVFIEKMIIALDNAIDASLKSVEKLLIINLFELNGNIVIEIKNTFSHKINLDNVGSKNYSTKGKGRGLGLFSALRDKEAVMTVKIINSLFVSRVSVKKIK